MIGVTGGIGFLGVAHAHLGIEPAPTGFDVRPELDITAGVAACARRLESPEL